MPLRHFSFFFIFFFRKYVLTDSNNIETNYTYDALGRITKEIQPFDSDVYPTKEYVYTIDGVAPERIIVMQKENSGATPTLDTRYYYDGFGNLIQVKTEAENSALQIAGNIYYDSLDRPVKTSNPYHVTFSGDYSSANASVSGFNYSYDPLDRVVQVLNPDNTRIQINFTLWNVSTLDERGKRKDYILDGNGNIIRVVEFYNNGTNVISFNTTYKYDALNQLIQINDSKANQFNFTYDSLGRTIRLQDPDLRTWNYTYDSLGNLIAQEGAGGELTTDGDYYREYNALHQLTKIRKKTSTGKIIEEYSYGPDGERIMTLNYLTNTTIYTPFREWMMIVNRTGSYNYTYVYDANTLISRINPDGTKWFYHDDHLGSTSLITDENGNIVEETFYNPFGQVTSGGEREAYLLYTNQMKDAIGCYDYGARVYCPKWYHFTSGDPITQSVYVPQYLNRYAYVRNNPYLYVDPDGRNARIYLDSEGGAGFGHYTVGIDDSNNQGHEVIFENHGIGDDKQLQVVGVTLLSSKNEGQRQILSFFGYSAKRDYTTSEIKRDSNGNAVPIEGYDEVIEIKQGKELDAIMIAKGYELEENPWSYYPGTHDSEDYSLEIIGSVYDLQDLKNHPSPRETFKKELKGQKWSVKENLATTYNSYVISNDNGANKKPSATKQKSTEWKKKGGKKK